MRRDEYVAGPHHFWVHFWCGLIFGAIFGAFISGRIFSSPKEVAASAAFAGLIFGYSCGRWGDSAWEFISNFLGGGGW